ncbi:AAA family ATPase [Nocardia sp. NPDC059240]|uniref:AAA family ATPase n=1 Tax=Nocardia sp. NPDC059240 TaxID=3346786 RepID=UPI003677735A
MGRVRMTADTVPCRRDEHGDRIYGRAGEFEVLEGALDVARAGRGSALLLWGEPGIGKTTLLRETARSAADFRILYGRGTRRETELPYAMLPQLLAPVAERVDALSPPQADALRCALGLNTSGANRFLVGAGLLTLVSELAADQPVLIVIDDIHWLDPAMTECLGFLARRLGGDPIVLLGAANHDVSEGRWDSARVVRLAGLDHESAVRLVYDRDPGIARGLADRMVTATGGHPLALRELPLDSLESALLGDGPLPVGPRLRRAFGARIDALAPDVRTVLLVLAAQDGGDPAVARTAVTALGVRESGWDAARDTGLIAVVNGRVELRHPLIGAVDYDAASTTQRRAAHRALAAAFERAGDADRRAWQLAALSESPSESVAGMLQEAAERAVAHGAPLSAARALLRAADLSVTDTAAAIRLARAARLAWQGGDAVLARSLWAKAESRGSRELVTRAGGGILGLSALSQGDNASARELLLRDAQMVDAATATELWRLADRAAWAVGTGFDDRQAAALMDVSGLDPVAQPWRIPPPTLAVALGHSEETDRMLRDTAAALRVRGDVCWLANVLAQRATLEVLTGRWDEAAVDAAEALRLSESQDTPNTTALAATVLGWLAAVRGEIAEAESWCATALDASLGRNARSLVAPVYWVRALIALGAGEPETALRELAEIAAPGGPAGHPVFAALTALDAVEAAVRAGRIDDARTHSAILESWGDRTGADWAVTAASTARALLADDADAEPHYLEALATPTPTWPTRRARTELLYGEWLRRVRRRAEAQTQLRSALQVFERLGATPWAERARRELELAGDRSVTTPEVRANPLTPQELRIARLAATGLTNREIGAQLFISPRTVGHHLSRVFVKLGLADRTDLAAIDFDGGMRLTR